MNYSSTVLTFTARFVPVLESKEESPSRKKDDSFVDVKFADSDSDSGADVVFDRVGSCYFSVFWSSFPQSVLPANWYSMHMSCGMFSFLFNNVGVDPNSILPCIHFRMRSCPPDRVVVGVDGVV